MTTRHAAALTLLGWYLMLPPIEQRSSEMSYVNTEAPLGKWTINTAFDRADACENAKLKGLRERWADKDRPVEANMPKNFNQSLLNAFALSQCVATDDPRLMQK